MTSDLIGSNSYKRYKTGTQKFTSWLVEAVRRCGENIVDVPNSTSKSRKKKGAESSAKGSLPAGESKYTIPIRDFTKLAEIVVNSKNPRILVPSNILGLLAEVISLRKEFSAWMSHVASHDHLRAQNDSHRHFIKILNQVKTILHQKEDPVPTTANEDKKENLPGNKLANIFEVLTLEEPEPVAHAATPAVPPLQNTQNLELMYDMETLHDEVLISSICYYQDLNATRDFIRNVWSDYREGLTALMTVSLLTNTAIEQIQRNTEDHLLMIKRWPDAPEEKNFIWWFYCHICEGDPLKREQPDDDINVELYDEAQLVCLPVQYFLQDWLASLNPRQLVFMKCSKLDVNRERSSMQPREKLGEDELFLNAMASQFHNAAKLQLEFPPAIDEISRAFRKVETDGTIPLWLVFAMQIVVDIRGVLREDVSRGFETICATGSRVTVTIQRYFRYSREIKGRKEKWHADNDSQILKVIGFIAEWIKQDKVSKAVRKHSKHWPEDMGFEVPPFFLLKNHPLLCGLIDYWLNYMVREFGISLTNAYDTILSTAHLYNATRQSNLLLTEWPDMEYLISVNTPQRLFIGGVPTTPEDFFKRFHIALGASARNFARNRRNIKSQESANDGGSRRIRKEYPIHQIFRGRYCALEPRSNLAIDKIDAVVAFEAAKSPGRDYPVAYCNQWVRNRKLTSVQLLGILRYSLEGEELHMYFDYISMHMRCVTLMTKLRSFFIAEANSYIGAIKDSDAEAYRSLQSYDILGDSTPARYLDEVGIPENFSMHTYLTNSVFLSDPAAAAVAEKVYSGAQAECWLLQHCQVSLKSVAVTMRQLIEKEGHLEVERAATLSPSHAQRKIEPARKLLVL